MCHRFKSRWLTCIGANAIRDAKIIERNTFYSGAAVVRTRGRYFVRTGESGNVGIKGVGKCWYVIAAKDERKKRRDGEDRRLDMRKDRAFFDGISMSKTEGAKSTFLENYFRLERKERSRDAYARTEGSFLERKD
ncbi:uncharacterized protein SPSK_10015 [Sporothrix schenckii 1099-18]|uniref:Uncharacterized protein n=1 Tax=Sporothrix schenckii 1099-18 TaxID=1397361 RepID=A0A0F2M9A5_SPOSC|nr:uncharacterized protein SPSK_10015 [Sporothrix schenckii 1099-18]KJR84741.1 hypothetical protein SPSK_10015 [Sporothrix schenckii 1099-18]